MGQRHAPTPAVRTQERDPDRERRGWSRFPLPALLAALAVGLLARGVVAGGAPPARASDAAAILDRVAARYLLPHRQEIQLEITAVIFGHTRRATGRVAYSPPGPGEDPEDGEAAVVIEGPASWVEREREGTTSRTGERGAWREIAPEHRTPVRSPILLALRGLDRKRAVLVGRQKAGDGAAGQVVIEAPLVDVEPRAESSTYLLGGIVHWGGKSPGLYRAKGVADAAPRSVGDDESSWWFLPLVSYQADEQDDSRELMLWPLLGLGFGKEEGQSYVRLFYFWKIGGKG